MPMPNQTRYAENSRPPAPLPEPRRLTDPPEWCDLFLEELFRQSVKHHRCNVQLACDLAGVYKSWAYDYRNRPQGRWFRIAWDLIVLNARTLHSKHHH